ncbi:MULTISPECIES: RadC family protein [Sphingobacterium]|uniref:DNA repair protein RadC n=2 Tax=Sphingobacterium hotanense TaxID=649196 RepID=A0ABT7NTG6_9SPHI|nr:MULTISPECIES: DNA repair protein RadC [Sphingobacterium]MCT1524345.1 DNA repair protein RadC [Sphingobacterium hotanense]MDM1050368.1 DNA repair protein RadC [Sphingobacterium hotanense]
MFQKMVIREWAEADRPREKLLERGRRAVTDAELLAIVIGSGSRTETAVELCKRVLAGVNHNLLQLSKLEVHDLCEYKGIGEAKAISIIAALELGRRRQETKQTDIPILNSSKLVYEFFRSQLQDLPHEEFWTIYLNTACKVVDTQLIGRGGNDFTPVDIRTIFRFALLNKCHSIILAHNHPSGTLKASDTDIKITQKIVRAAELIDIRVHDHLIFTDCAYLSFRDEGLL